MSNPLVAFDPTEPSAVIRFDVPLPAFFDGKHVIDINIKDKDWIAPIQSYLSAENKAIEEEATGSASSSTKPDKPVYNKMKHFYDESKLKVPRELRTALKLSPTERIIRSVGEDTILNVPVELHEKFGGLKEGEEKLSIRAADLRKLDADVVVPNISVNRKMNMVYNIAVMPTVEMPTFDIHQIPRIVLIERYRLENYLGNYGLGKTISSFYVHPKSKVNISIKSWKKTATSYEEASSIFDSITEKSSDNFTESFNSVRSHTTTLSADLQFSSEVKGKAGFLGIGKVEASAGVKGSTTATRTDFAKDVSHTVSSHASASSARRDLQHSVTSSVDTVTGEKESIVREITNQNSGHVLNFLIRELNQEYYSIQVLKDVRVAFIVGGNLVEEVPLYDIDEVLTKYIGATKVKRYRDYILQEYSYIKDYEGVRKSLIKLHKYTDDRHFTDTGLAARNYDTSKHYILLNQDKNNTGVIVGGRINGAELAVEGIPISVTKVVLKTDGVVCSSLLDPGDALDSYSKEFQAEELRTETLLNDLTLEEIEKNKLARDIIENGPDEEVERFEKIYGADSFEVIPGDVDRGDAG